MARSPRCSPPSRTATSGSTSTTRSRSQPERRFVALVGDAELDEGNVWEAVLEEGLGDLGNVTMIVDLNRQSLDRVVPGIRIRRVEGMFAAAGWHAIEAKYGRRLQARFAMPGGDALRERIDDMENEEYQILIRRPGAEARERLLEGAPTARRDVLAQHVDDVPDDDLPGLLADLGGHDQAELEAALRCVRRTRRTRPTVIFAYTIKGWRLPFAGDSLNHSALLRAEQVERRWATHSVPTPDDPWAGFAADSPEGQLLRAAVGASSDTPHPSRRSCPPPRRRSRCRMSGSPAATSTQQAFGDTLAALARDAEVGGRIVTAAPDVAVSTNLGGWINRAGVFSPNRSPRIATTSSGRSSGSPVRPGATSSSASAR